MLNEMSMVVIITKDLSDNDDMSMPYKRTYAQDNALSQMCYMCKMYPVQTFSTLLWVVIAAESIRKLYVAYNNIFRLLAMNLEIVMSV